MKWLKKRKENKEQESRRAQRRDSLTNQVWAATLLDVQGKPLGKIRRKGHTQALPCGGSGVVTGKDRIKSILKSAGGFVECDGGDILPVHKIHRVEIKAE